MDEIQDPTLVQPTCAGCGLPIRSDSFEIRTPHYRHEIPTANGVMVTGTSGIPGPAPFRGYGSWIHDDPRGTPQMILGRGDHEIYPQEFGPLHTHETDYERQLRNWKLDEVEAKSHLGNQFRK